LTFDQIRSTIGEADDAQDFGRKDAELTRWIIE